MKKLVLALLTIAICLTPLFSYSQNTNAATESPKVNDLTLLRQAKDNVNITILKERGLSDSTIQELGDNIDVVASLVKPQISVTTQSQSTSTVLTDSQLKNLIDGLKLSKTNLDSGETYNVENGYVKMNDKIVPVPHSLSEQEKEQLKVLQTQDKTQKSVPSLKLDASNLKSTLEASSIPNNQYTQDTLTGAHRVTTSGYSYIKGTGWYQLPTVGINTNSYYADAAYGMGNIFNDSYSVGADLGVYTNDSIGRYWRTAINMGLPGWATCSETKFNNGECGWRSGTVTIDRFAHPKLYIIWGAVNPADYNGNTVVIQVYDGDTYQFLTSMGWYAPNRGFNYDGTGGNVYLKYEHALACTNQYNLGVKVKTCDLANGSYMLNSKWGGVNIYSPNASSPWYSSYSKWYPEIGDTPSEKRTIQLLSETRDTDSAVNINFNLQ